MNVNPEKSTAGVRRRSVLKGAAWSVPVVAAAVITPLAAASGCAGYVGHIVATPGGGNNKYLLTMTLTKSPSTTPVNLTNVSFQVKLSSGHSFKGTTGQAHSVVSNETTTSLTVTAGAGTTATGVMLNQVSGGVPKGLVTVTGIPGCGTLGPFAF